MNQSDLGKLFFLLSALKPLENCTLIKGIETEIFFFKNFSSLEKKISSTNGIEEIYLSGLFDLNDLENLVKTHRNIKFYSKEKTNIKKLYYSDMFQKYFEMSSPIRDVAQLMDNNELFSKFMKENANQNSVRMIKNLVQSNILYAGRKLDFTDCGKAFFSYSYHTKTNVNIKTYFNNVNYVSERSFIEPLFLRINTLTDFIYNNINEFQKRQYGRAEVFKLLTADSLKQLILFILSEADLFKEITFNLNDSFIMVNYSLNEKPIIYPFLEMFFNLRVKTISNLVDSKLIKIHKSVYEKEAKILITYYSRDKIEEMNLLDKEILHFIEENKIVSRKQIDERFSISPRTSNTRIRKLLKNELIIAIGNGKSIKYKKAV